MSHNIQELSPHITGISIVIYSIDHIFTALTKLNVETNMKFFLISIAFTLLTGCTRALTTNTHMQEPPRFDMIETATYKSAKSLELSGWISGIPNSSNAIADTIDTTKSISGTDLYSDTTLYSLARYFYSPRFTAGGSIGWNFSRYFCLGVQGSFAQTYDIPSRYKEEFDDINVRWGYYMRIGGPLNEKENVSLVGNIKHSFGTYDLIIIENGTIRRDSASITNEATRMESEYNLAIQVRPIKYVGIFGGIGIGGQHIFSQMFTADEKESQMELLAYLGVSIYPTRTLAISPWIGETNTTKLGMRIEYMPSFE